ncbi:retrovirus-related pol polyprotein from transposon TNT 1-94 [Tanacetum coccineum]
MLNRNCSTSFVKPEFLKKDQRANPRLYDIGCYNDYLALMLALESDEMIRLAQESRSKLNPFVQNTIEGNFGPQIRVILADLEKFHLCLKEEMVDDLRYFNSLEHEQSQEQLNNDKLWKQKESTSFLDLNVKYFEIQDLKAQLQDKSIAISKPATFSDYLAHKDLSKSKSVTLNNVSNDLSKPVTAHILPQNMNTVQKNINVIASGMYKLDNLFIIDFGCSKHMTRNLKLLSNFVERFLGTVKFGNDQIAPILGYGDLVQENITIKTVLIEIILFIVDSGCSKHMTGNLKLLSNFVQKFLVAFRKSTCYIRDLKGNDLLTGSCGTDLYSITLQDTSTPNPICLMAKASSSQAWLWHRRLSHLNFDTINLLSKYDIVKDHLCSSCELGKAKLSTSNELDFLFSPMFDELLNGTTPVESKYTSIEHSNNTLNYKSSTNSSQAPAITTTKNINQAETNKENAQADKDEFINIFSTPVHEQGETSSRYVNSSNMYTFYQRHPFEHRWTKDHLLEQVIRNPSQSIRTRCQLETYGEMCMFALIVSQTEPKNIKESMADSSWIETMQEEIHQFE